MEYSFDVTSDAIDKLEIPAIHLFIRKLNLLKWPNNYHHIFTRVTFFPHVIFSFLGGYITESK